MEELNETHRDVYRALVDVVQRKTALEAEEAALREQLRQELMPGNYVINGKEALSIRVTRRFDPTVALEVVPPGIIPSISRINASAAKAVLPPALYEKCQRELPNRTVVLK